MPLYIGIDLGTSGCRAIAIDEHAVIAGEAYANLPPPEVEGASVQQTPELWWDATCVVLAELTQKIPSSEVSAICVDATSATVLLVDPHGHPVSAALMYNDARAGAQAQRLNKLVPATSAASGPSSTLAKVLWFKDQGMLNASNRPCHQADWLLGQLSGEYRLSDVNNCLKLGFDPIAGRWPDWLETTGVDRSWLPQVVSPGTAIGALRTELCQRFNLPATTSILAGTTDSTAAFIASGATQAGEAVTCLGSTLVLKVLSEQPLFAPEYGVYSQPLLGKWLAGGASNSGGAVLLKHFNKDQLQQLTAVLNPEQFTGLDYYPLLRAGERFPINDPAKAPQLSPRPHNDVTFFQAMLEGMANIEKRGYDLLHSLGAPYPVKVYTNGGGAVNEPWRYIRERILHVPVVKAAQVQAAYGTALLARRSLAGA